MSSPTQVAGCAVAPAWPMQRILFLLAGSVTLIGVLLTVTVSSSFLLVPGLVGINQLLMVATGWCPMSLVLSRLGIGRAPTPDRRRT